MTELRDPQTPNSSQPAGARTASGDASDPLHNLYRMSRTAGLGSGDYVAINNTAIVALCLGCFSVFALLYPTVLVAAAAAVICGILAMVQIRNSSGTQSGRAFAGLGILLGLGIGGLVAGKMVAAGMETRRDEQAIDAVVKKLGERLVAKDYAGAYTELFTDNFKSNFSQQAFADRWESFRPIYGDVRSVDWGHTAAIETVAGTKQKRGFATSMVQFEKFQDPARQSMTFAEQDGKWLVDGVGNLFEKPRETKQEAMPDPRAPLGPQMTLPDPAAPQGPAPQAPAPQ